MGIFRPELLTAGHAIVHDKIIVIDPCDEQNCAVITGSHNLGYKASYCNDDNLLIVAGNRPPAMVAVYVLDLYDHYVFRARLEQNLRDQLKSGQIHSFTQAAQSDPHGLLHLSADWQMSHFAPDRPRSALDYFLGHRPRRYGGPPPSSPSTSGPIIVTSPAPTVRTRSPGRTSPATDAGTADQEGT